MKTRLSLCLLVFTLCIPVTVCAQSDSLQAGKKLAALYTSLGIDFCSNGLGVSVNGTFILSNNWGGNVRFNFNAVEAKNLPDDYYDFVLFIPWGSNGLPTDKYNMLSFNMVKEFMLSTKYLRFGVEFGPSLVMAQISEFTPVENPIPFFGSNYTITMDKKNALGLSLRGKVEAPVTRYAGVEIALFTNLNGVKSIIGMDFCLTLGLVRQ